MPNEHTGENEHHPFQWSLTAHLNEVVMVMVMVTVVVIVIVIEMAMVTLVP